MTSRSYFGKMNSTLGSVVPLAMLIWSAPSQNSYNKAINITRPKPPFGRQGLAGSWGKDKVRRVNFGVFSTSHFAHLALSSD